MKSVSHDYDPCKTAELIETAVWLVNSWDPRKALELDEGLHLRYAWNQIL